MVYCELGIFPMVINRYCRMIRYWFKLLTSENCILYNCYQDMYEKCCLRYTDKFNWACNIRDILYLYGFHDVWLNQGVNNVNVFLCQFRERVEGRFISEMVTF